MDLIKDADFRKELNNNPRPGYLFFGDEDYLKSFAIKLAREVICPDPTLPFLMRFASMQWTLMRKN